MQQDIANGSSVIPRKRGWWRRFRNKHRPGFLARTIASRIMNGEGSHGVRGAKYKVAAKSIDTCTVGNGDVLRATLLWPEGTQGPWPCILMRTPYGRKSDFGQAMLAARGYGVVVQDTRGRFSSDGQFVPVQHEREDGPATVEWIRQQAWCNGKVGVTGISYLGFTAWACIDNGNVDAIVPVITQSSVKSAVFHPKGAVSFELIVLWFYLVVHLMSDLQTDPKSFFRKLWTGLWQRTLHRSMSHIPINEMDQKLLGYTHEFLQAGLKAHSDPDDPFWDDKDKLCYFRKPVPPCHILTGWYDMFLSGALKDYAQMKNDRRVRLTVGPFAHWGFIGSPDLYMETLVTAFDQALLEAETDTTLPVRLYVLGSGWHRYSDYPPPSKPYFYFLRPDFSLSKQADPMQPDLLNHKYVYDPAHPTPACGGPSFNFFNHGAQDQSKIEARRDVLVYSTDPQTHAFNVIGPVKLCLEVSCKLASVDYVGRFCLVDRAGVSTNLCEGLSSTSNNLEDSAMSVEVDVGHIAVSVKPGERLRLHICSAAHPRWLRNLGGGEPIGSATSFCAGDVTIHSGKLILPVEQRMATVSANASGPAMLSRL